MILVDNETKVDLLNNEAIALTIIKILRARPEKPVTLGVHGDWGAGKSSVLEMIEAALETDKNVLCVKFNGWRFQGFEDAKIALIEGVVQGLLEKRSLTTKALTAAKDLLKRVDTLKLAKKGGGLAWNVATGMPSPDQISDALGILRGLADNPEGLVGKENTENTVKNLSGLLKPAEAKRIPKEIDEFRKAFDNLLKEAEIDQLIVLVDDLDRCLPVTTIETLEAIRLFIFTKRTAFIVGADEAMVEYAVRKHFPDLPDMTGPKDYARNYLEKLIQVPFRIPALGEAETRIYITLLLIGSLLEEDDPKFLKLIAEGRERLKRPWDSKPLDSTAVKAELGNNTAALEMLILSNQVSPILASGTKGNPRQIKRFLNALLLRKAIADARGFGEEIKLPVLAKLMLAERFRPTLFDQIAKSASSEPNGICKELGMLEANAKDQKEVAASNKILAAWLGSEPIMSWSKLEPKLADVDLRPYLFVARDKKDYFGGSAALGKLGDLLGKLQGERLAAKSVTTELQSLVPPDASALFDELRVIILSKDSYNTKPEGMEGMVALVGAHTHLESNLLDLLDELPAANLGLWAAGGWEACIRDADNKERLSEILGRWEQTGSKSLKTAIGLTKGAR